MQHGALAHLLSRAAHRHEIAKVRRGGPRLAPEEKELYNTKAALEGWVSNLWCAKSYRRHSPKPQKSPTALVMGSNGRAWLYCTCEWRHRLSRPPDTAYRIKSRKVDAEPGVMSSAR